jgi:hypothetical protein
MPVKALWFDGRPNMLVSSDQNTLMQREKGRVAGDVSVSLAFNSHPRPFSINPYSGRAIDSLSLPRQPELSMSQTYLYHQPTQLNIG